MNWRVVVRPAVGDDVNEAAAWYESNREGLGAEFTEEILAVFDALAMNPLLGPRRDPFRNIRWRYPNRFPYRVIYEVLEDEHTVVVATVLHAARSDRYWRRRI